MYEDQELWEAAPEYAAKKASYVIAHEGVHQLLANSGIQSRLSNWSPWIREGLAEYYCPLKVNSSLIRKANSELPTRTMKWTKAGMVNDLRMYSLLEDKCQFRQRAKKTCRGGGYRRRWVCALLGTRALFGEQKD